MKHMAQGHQVKGRAAGSNRVGRFEKHERVAADDGWDFQDEKPVLRTQTQIEVPRRIISYNRSPDLPFDRSINPYRGCEHGCIYCFARPSHAFLGLSPGLDFETRLIARPDAAVLLRKELGARNYQVAPLAIGTNTDPYQPIERTYGIMRRCLEVLAEARHPVAIVTKGSLIERDIDILRDMAAEGLARVGVSVTTLDPAISRVMEPRVPPPARRLQMIERLSKAGIPVRVMASPMVPGLTDMELERILQAGRDAGACHASWIMLRLPREVSDLVQEWLNVNFPNQAGKVMMLLREMHGGKTYDPAWHRRMRGTGPYAELVSKRFDVALRRLGLGKSAPPLRCDLFQAPKRDTDQLELF